MTLNGPFAIARRTEVLPPRFAAQRVEKPSQSAQLHGERRDEDASARCPFAQRMRGHLSHKGTEDVAPLWYGPRLRPAFVAQVLGQVTAQSKNISAAQVYRSHTEAAPVLLAKA